MVIRRGFLAPGARFSRVGLASILALALAWAMVVEPAGPLPCSCMFHEITGKSCFTCGLTRSVHAASRGDLQAAVRFHLLGPVVLAGALLATMTCLAEALVGKRMLSAGASRWRLQVILGAMIIWVVYGVLRMAAELV